MMPGNGVMVRESQTAPGSKREVKAKGRDGSGDEGWVTEKRGLKGQTMDRQGTRKVIDRTVRVSAKAEAFVPQGRWARGIIWSALAGLLGSPVFFTFLRRHFYSRVAAGAVFVTGIGYNIGRTGSLDGFLRMQRAVRPVEDLILLQSGAYPIPFAGWPACGILHGNSESLVVEYDILKREPAVQVQHRYPLQVFGRTICVRQLL